MKYFTLIPIFLLLLFCTAAADRLPEGVPENQVFTTSSIIEAVGTTTESTTAVWQTSDAGLETLPKPVRDDDALKSGSIAYVTYKDTITTNGGQISEVKSFSMDTHAKTEGLYNIQTEKVLTYTSQNGSHLMGAESYVLDVAGNWSAGVSDLVCVFSRSEQEITPAFCNKVTASSKLNSITTAQIESVGTARAVGTSPAALNYEISVTPDANSASGYADGIVSTTFTVSVMEGRSDGEINVLNDPLGGGWSHVMNQFESGWEWNGNMERFERIRVSKEKNGLLHIKVRHLNRLYDTTHSDIYIESFLNIGNIPQAAKDIISFYYNRDGTVTVTFLGAAYNVDPLSSNEPVSLSAEYVLEHYDELAATITASDTATVSGGISQFVKVFNYQSGVACDGC